MGEYPFTAGVSVSRLTFPTVPVFHTSESPRSALVNNESVSFRDADAHTRSSTPHRARGLLSSYQYICRRNTATVYAHKAVAALAAPWRHAQPKVTAAPP